MDKLRKPATESVAAEKVVHRVEILDRHIRSPRRRLPWNLCAKEVRKSIISYGFLLKRAIETTPFSRVGRRKDRIELLSEQLQLEMET